MPTTLLAVDDSVTMRKVIEITFAGEDFRVVTAESADAALKKARAEKPSVVLLDVTLPEMDGYAVCRALKQELPSLGVVIMSAKQGPYDATRGTAAGADDFIDKPFDTQQLIDKVKKVLTAKANAPAVAAPPPPPPARPTAPSAPTAQEAPKAGGTLPGTSGPARPGIVAPSPVAAPVAPKATAIFGGPPAPTPSPAPGRAPSPPTPVTGVQRPAAPVAPSPAPAAVAPAAPPAPPPPQPTTQPAIAAAVDGHLGEKLAGLGLNPQQADAVLALSREVVERIVWEVVPVLAETLIKEEIKRLTAEG